MIFQEPDGFVELSLDEQQRGYWVDTVKVAHAYRRKGVGTRLMQNVCRWADEQNVQLRLIAFPMGQESMQHARLIEWYRERFAFVRTAMVGEAREKSDYLVREPRRGPYERLWTRSDYMAGVVGHDVYYASMALRGGVRGFLPESFAPMVYALAIGDLSFGSISREWWDRAGHWCWEKIAAGMPDDETDSPATRVCALKALARVIAGGSIEGVCFGLDPWEEGGRPLFG